MRVDVAVGFLAVLASIHGAVREHLRKCRISGNKHSLHFAVSLRQCSPTWLVTSMKCELLALEVRKNSAHVQLCRFFEPGVIDGSLGVRFGVSFWLWSKVSFDRIATLGAGFAYLSLPGNASRA